MRSLIVAVVILYPPNRSISHSVPYESITLSTAQRRDKPVHILYLHLNPLYSTPNVHGIIPPILEFKALLEIHPSAFYSSSLLEYARRKFPDPIDSVFVGSEASLSFHVQSIFIENDILSVQLVPDNGDDPGEVLLFDLKTLLSMPEFQTSLGASPWSCDVSPSPIQPEDSDYISYFHSFTLQSKPTHRIAPMPLPASPSPSPAPFLNGLGADATGRRKSASNMINPMHPCLKQALLHRLVLTSATSLYDFNFSPLHTLRRYRKPEIFLNSVSLFPRFVSAPDGANNSLCFKAPAQETDAVTGIDKCQFYFHEDCNSIMYIGRGSIERFWLQTPTQSMIHNLSASSSSSLSQTTPFPRSCISCHTFSAKEPAHDDHYLCPKCEALISNYIEPEEDSSSSLAKEIMENRGGAAPYFSGQSALVPWGRIVASHPDGRFWPIDGHGRQEQYVFADDKDEYRSVILSHCYEDELQVCATLVGQCKSRGAFDETFYAVSDGSDDEDYDDDYSSRKKKSKASRKKETKKTKSKQNNQSNNDDHNMTIYSVYFHCWKTGELLRIMPIPQFNADKTPLQLPSVQQIVSGDADCTLVMDKDTILLLSSIRGKQACSVVILSLRE